MQKGGSAYTRDGLYASIYGSQRQRVGEEGRQQRVVNSIVWNDIFSMAVGGEGRTHGLLGKPVGGQATAHNAGGQPWSVNWGDGFTLIISKASNR